MTISSFALLNNHNKTLIASDESIVINQHQIFTVAMRWWNKKKRLHV
jgi:hypothetical protein